MKKGLPRAMDQARRFAQQYPEQAETALAHLESQIHESGGRDHRQIGLYHALEEIHRGTRREFRRPHPIVYRNGALVARMRREMRRGD